MFRHKLSPIIYLLIGLAIFGFATQLFTNTVSLVTNILVMIAVGVIVYGAIYYFILRKRTTNDLKKYKKAVKQSKMKYKQDKFGKKAPHNTTVKKQTPLIHKRKNVKSRATHLRVIEGNKQKGKNRASF